MPLKRIARTDLDAYPGGLFSFGQGLIRRQANTGRTLMLILMWVMIWLMTLASHISICLNLVQRYKCDSAPYSADFLIRLILLHECLSIFG